MGNHFHRGETRMALIPQFDPPANIDDFQTADQRKRWSQRVDRFFNDGVQSVLGLVAPGESSQFYNPRVTDTSDPHAERVIDWVGFPKLVELRHPGNFLAACQE